MELLRAFIPLSVILMIGITVAPVPVVSTKSVGFDDYPVVNTTVGQIRGLRADDGSAMFLGIPYAKIDNNNPFGPPAEEHPTFDNVFNAHDDSARCPQIVLINETTLDCLHINIHVPNTTHNKPLPVFVYIHGGGFFNRSAGRNNIGPKFLIRHDVIFVAFNYRLSVYGFMCLNLPEAPGNQGLKDQLIAMRWLKKNIKAFGGDDENITISGDSAGGISVHFHLLYAEEGLFHKVVTQSGTAFSPWVFHEPTLNASIILANQMGHVSNDASEALKFLSTQDSKQVMTAVAALGMVLGPCLEQVFPNVEPYITVHPINIPSTKAKNIPLLSGYNSDEWVNIYQNLPPPVLEMLDIFSNNLNFIFNFGDKHRDMTSFVHRFYAADEPLSVNLTRAITDFDSDFIVGHPTQRTVGQHIAYEGVVYHYVFSYVGGRNNNNGGAAHSDELRYLYDMPDFPETPTPEDQLIIDRITTLWTNFAKYGNPTPSTTELLPVQWLPATRDRLNYLDISTTMSLDARPFYRRHAFWDFFFHANRKYIRGLINDTTQ